MVDTFHFKTRVDLSDPMVAGAYERAFFPEISRNYAKLFGDGLTAELNTVLINGEIALVGGSGEFFCNHANRLKARSYVKHTLFFGYCNGHGDVLPHHRGRLGRGLRRRPRRLVRRARGRANG